MTQTQVLERKPAGLAIELAVYVKNGRLSQMVESISEAAQLLEAQGWKQSGKRIMFLEANQPN
jgi:hypothetical protein